MVFLLNTGDRPFHGKGALKPQQTQIPLRPTRLQTRIPVFSNRINQSPPSKAAVHLLLAGRRLLADLHSVAATAAAVGSLLFSLSDLPLHHSSSFRSYSPERSRLSTFQNASLGGDRRSGLFGCRRRGVPGIDWVARWV